MAELEKFVVAVDQDLCRCGGLCTDIAPDNFHLGRDGLSYVKDNTRKDPDEPTHAGLDQTVRIAEANLEAVTEAAEECPYECIFISLAAPVGTLVQIGTVD